MQYSNIHSQFLREKNNIPMLIPEAPIVNPNAALGTPPRLNSDGEADNEIEELLENSGTDEGILYLYVYTIDTEYGCSFKNFIIFIL